MTTTHPTVRAQGEAGFTLVESLVALAIFAATVLMFERAVADAWRGVDAANMKTGAVSLALRLLDDAGADFTAEQETEGWVDRYAWRRRITLADGGSDPSTPSRDQVMTFWVEAVVSWRDGAAGAAHSVRYRLLKAGRPAS